jgi:hypothetical protein
MFFSFIFLFLIRYSNPGPSILEADAMTTAYATPPGHNVVKYYFETETIATWLGTPTF